MLTLQHPCPRPALPPHPLLQTPSKRRTSFPSTTSEAAVSAGQQEPKGEEGRGRRTAQAPPERTPLQILLLRRTVSQEALYPHPRSQVSVSHASRLSIGTQSALWYCSLR